MSFLKPKPAAESLTTMTEMVLPNDTNTLNNLMGGRLLYWMDIASAVAAQKHADRLVVTASVDNVSFSEPIRLGEIITIKAFVTRSFNTSMEVYLEVWANDYAKHKKQLTNKAFYTFVAVDEDKKPVAVPELLPESEEEKELYKSALRRRELRLVLAGRMKAKDSTELKALFEIN